LTASDIRPPKPTSFAPFSERAAARLCDPAGACTYTIPTTHYHTRCVPSCTLGPIAGTGTEERFTFAPVIASGIGVGGGSSVRPDVIRRDAKTCDATLVHFAAVIDASLRRKRRKSRAALSWPKLSPTTQRTRAPRAISPPVPAGRGKERFARSRQRFNSIPKPRGDQRAAVLHRPGMGLLVPRCRRRCGRPAWLLLVFGSAAQMPASGGSGGTEFKNRGVLLGLTPCSKS
jgi:hypothetical protein